MADLYVSATGKDTNNGSANSPFKTIQAAANHATSGTTVHVAAGTYAGGIDTKVNNVTYQAEGVVKIIGGTTSNGDIWTQRGNNVVIRGFDISGANSSRAYTLLTELGSNEMVANCVLHDLQTRKLLSWGGAFVADADNGGSGGTITGCRVYNVGPSGAQSNTVQGIYIAAHDWTVNNDLIYNVCGTGITSWHDATHLTITFDTVDKCYQGITIGAADSNNKNDYSAVTNTIVSNTVAGIDEEGVTGIHNIYQNNVVWHNSSFDYNLLNGLKATGTIHADPRYKNPAAGDYSLQPGSPATGKGASISGPTPTAAASTLSSPQAASDSLTSADQASVADGSAGATRHTATTAPGAASLALTTTPRTIEVSDGATVTVAAGEVNITGSATVNVSGNATINAGTGTDTIRVTAGNVVVNGSTGTLSFAGGGGTTTLNLKGGNTAATFGSGGAVVNVGGTGTFTGGSGVELYNFVKDSVLDRVIINNFTVGTDHLRLTGYGSTTQGVRTITDGSTGVSIGLADGSSISLVGVHTATPTSLFA
jgi:hypothetical protein